MNSGLVRRQTPEEQELERKLAELSAVEAELAQGELNLATLQAELHTFEREYLQVVGIRYTELDRIEAQISEYMAYLESSREFKPSENLKKLYREVAKRIHPDLATDAAERSHRQRLMAEVNQAYEDGDEKRLQAILHNWESRPESIKGGGVADELIRVIRKIAQGRDRLKAIEEEIEALEETELHQLKTQVVTAKQVGQDLLEEMALQLDEQIAAAQQRLEELKVNLELQK